MDDVFTVECNHCVCYLLEIPLCFKFGKSSMLTEVRLKISAITQFKDDVIRVFSSFEAYEFDYVTMSDSIEYIKFILKKLSQVLVSNHVELDNFDGHLSWLLTRIDFLHLALIHA